MGSENIKGGEEMMPELSDEEFMRQFKIRAGKMLAKRFGVPVHVLPGRGMVTQDGISFSEQDVTVAMQFGFYQMLKMYADESNRQPVETPKVLAVAG